MSEVTAQQGRDSNERAKKTALFQRPVLLTLPAVTSPARLRSLFSQGFLAKRIDLVLLPPLVAQ